MTESPAAPLVVSADSVLLDVLGRLAAAAGLGLQVTDTLAEAMSHWASAPLVLVGTDRAAPMAQAHPPMRSDVVVVGRGTVPDEHYRHAVGLGATSVVDLAVAEPWLADRLADLADGAIGAGRLVGVIGGAGGSGASAFAAALATVCAEQTRTVLVDADADGGGSDRWLGLDEVPGVRWEALASGSGRLSARSLSDALPRRGSLGVLAYPPGMATGVDGLSATVVGEAIAAIRRACDVTVVDLARRPAPPFADLTAACDAVVVVATLTVPAVVATTRVVARLPSAPAGLVLRTGGHGVREVDAAHLLDTPVLATMSDQRGLDESVALGLGPLRGRRGPLARAARIVAHAVALPDGSGGRAR